MAEGSGASTNPTSGAGDDANLSDSDKNSLDNSGEDGKGDKNPYKRDMLAYKDKLKAEREKNKELAAKLTEIEKAKEDQNGNDLKVLIERYKKENIELKTKTETLKEGLLYSEKHRAVFSELKSLGLRDEAERYLENEDLKDIEVETTSKGRINVLGAKDWALDYKEKNKIFFDLGKNPKINSSDGRSGGRPGSGGNISAAEVNAAEHAYNTEKDPTKKMEKELVYKNKVLEFKKNKKQRSA